MLDEYHQVSPRPLALIAKHGPADPDDPVMTPQAFPEDVLASIAKQSLLGLQHLHTMHKVDSAGHNPHCHLA